MQIHAERCQKPSQKSCLVRLGSPLRVSLACPDTQGAHLKRPRDIGFPVALKLNGEAIAHKTERGLVRLGLADSNSLAEAGGKPCWRWPAPRTGQVDLLVAEMVDGAKGTHRRGSCAILNLAPAWCWGWGGCSRRPWVMLFLRRSPLSRQDAEMLDRRPVQQRLADAAFSGENRLFTGVPWLIYWRDSPVWPQERPEVMSVDLNPADHLAGGRPVPVDALVELDPGSRRSGGFTRAPLGRRIARAVSDLSFIPRA